MLDIYIYPGIPRLTILHISNTFKRFCTFILYLYNERGALHYTAVYNFSCVNVYKRPDAGSQLEPKHVAVNKLINTGVVCDLFDTCTCDLLTPTGMSNCSSRGLSKSAQARCLMSKT
jgi:hypothetical protein